MISVFSIVFLFLASVVPVLAAETGTFRAGAAKIDITPGLMQDFSATR